MCSTANDSWNVLTICDLGRDRSYIFVIAVVFGVYVVKALNSERVNLFLKWIFVNVNKSFDNIKGLCHSKGHNLYQHFKRRATFEITHPYKFLKMFEISML